MWNNVIVLKRIYSNWNFEADLKTKIVHIQQCGLWQIRKFSFLKRKVFVTQHDLWAMSKKHCATEGWLFTFTGL